MNKKRYKDWQIDDPEVVAILGDVIRSSKKTYYRIGTDGKHVTARVKVELMQLPMNGVFATRLLQKYPFPEGSFVRNRKRKLITDEVLAARLAAKVERAAARAFRAEAKVMQALTVKKQHKELAAEAYQAISEVACEAAAVEEIESEEMPTQIETRGRKRTTEMNADKHHCLVQRGEWFGIYSGLNGTVRLVSRDKTDALAAMEEYRNGEAQ